MKRGDRVRMTEAYKTLLCGKCGIKGQHKGPFNGGDDCYGCSRDHIVEFGECVGIVEDLADYNNVKPGEPGYDKGKVGPEWTVCWQPDNLRYHYLPEQLKKV